MRTREIHVSLPQEAVQRLDALALEDQTTRNAVIQTLIAEGLRQQEKAKVLVAMRKDAEALGKYSLEVTKELESHVMERLLRETEW